MSPPSMSRPIEVLAIEWCTSTLSAPDASLVTASVSVSIVEISTLTPYSFSKSAITSGFT